MATVTSQQLSSNKEIDAFGNESVIPFIIDCPFIVTVTGFDQEGVNLGFPGYYNDEDVQEDAYVLWNTNKDEQLSFGKFYARTLNLGVCFTSMFDAARVWESASANGEEETQTIENFNVLKVSADGKTIENMGYPEISFVYSETAINWFQMENDAPVAANYVLFDALSEDGDIPAWLNYGVDNSDYGSEDHGAINYIGLQDVEALPAGTTGRYAVLLIAGKGINSAEPIYVLQGDAKLEDAKAAYEAYIAGIDNVKANNNTVKTTATYNLAGQKVGKNFKGIVVRNGKKFMVK